jgi:two-component system, OmpR family, sensor histidine kinase KdpD
MPISGYVCVPDLDPEELRERIARLYPPGTAERALAGYFQPGNLAALHAMARRWMNEHGFSHRRSRGNP